MFESPYPVIYSPYQSGENNYVGYAPYISHNIEEIIGLVGLDILFAEMNVSYESYENH